MAQLPISGVYAIRNLVSGRVYVGSSSDVKRRWLCHRNLLGRDAHHAKRLQGAWNHRGEQAFVLEVLEVAPVASLFVREQYWIDHYQATAFKCGYNILPNAGTTAGGTLTSQHRLRISAALKVHQRSPEHLAKIVAVNQSRAGRKASEQTRAKLSHAQRAWRENPENKAKDAARMREIARRRIGTHLSEATKAKISMKAMGKSKTTEQRAKVSASVKRTKAFQKAARVQEVTCKLPEQLQQAAE